MNTDSIFIDNIQKEKACVEVARLYKVRLISKFFASSVLVLNIKRISEVTGILVLVATKTI